MLFGLKIKHLAACGFCAIGVYLIMLTKLYIVLCCFVFALAPAQNSPEQKVITPHASPSLRFTENKGQWESNILFRAQLDGGALFLEKNSLTFNFYDKVRYRQLHHGQFPPDKNADVKGHAYRISFVNANTDPLIDKKQEGKDYENFFLGNDESRWKSEVKNYQQVLLRNIYNQIDYEVLSSARGIKYNFYVAAGGDPSQIKMAYEGIDQLSLKKGALITKLSVNGVTEQKPYAYQIINGETREVACNYRLKNKVVSFDFPNGYDQRYELVIDPVLVFAAQSGSTADNFGMTATYDAQGNLYSGGIVYSAGYPTTLGAYSSSFFGPIYYGNTDVVVTKYNSTGTALIYSTYLGGFYTETVHSMVVDNSNNLCIYGVTSSANFPVLQNAYDNTFNGGSFLMFVSNGMRFVNGTDIYITKFNASGSALLASTFLGGTGNDGVNHSDQYTNSYVVPATPPQQGNLIVFEPDYDSLQYNYGDQCRGEIQVDAANNIYVTSSTRSFNFPTVNSFDNTLGGRQDGIISKLNSNLSSLLYSSYIGGSSVDAGYGLIVMPNQQVYVTGGTSSQNFPFVSGGYQSSYQGGIADGYVIRISASGNTVLNGTYFGTPQYDQSYFIQSDKYSNIYIYGQSLGNVPVVVASNAATIFSVSGTHQFISRFNSTLNTLNMSTKFGNQQNDVDISPSAFSVDRCNNIYVSGWGGNLLTQNQPMANMPLMIPTQGSTTGYDFYFMGLDSNGVNLDYGSYFGGPISREHVDGGTSRFDPQGKIYQSVCAGCGGNDDFPVTPGSWPGTPGNPNYSGNCNNGVIKLDFQLQLAIATINTNTLAGCNPMTVTFTNATPPTGTNSSYMWYLGNGVTTSTNINPTVTYTLPGTYTVSLVVRDEQTCNRKDSTITYITVYPKPSSTLNVQSSQCSNTVNLSQTTSGNLGVNPFQWNLGDGSPLVTSGTLSHTYQTNGNYNITFTVTDINGCKDIQSTPVSVFSFSPLAAGTQSICRGSAVTLTASGGTGYTWTPGGSLNNPNIANPVASPNSTTVYSIQIANNSPGYTCVKTLTVQLDVAPTPTAGFNIISTPCTNTVVTTNISTGNFGPGPYAWNFGDGSPVSGEQSPAYAYTADGVYNIELSVTDVNGCKSVLTKSVAILNFMPGVINSDTVCYGNSIQLSALGGTGYSWTPATSLNDPNNPSPIASPLETTVYSVQIVNTSFGYSCVANLTTQVQVNPTPTTSFSYSMNPCGGGVYFFDKSESDIVAWNWELFPGITRTVQNAYHFYSAGGIHTVTLSVTNAYGCKHSKTEVIDIETPPPLSISKADTICYGDSVQLSASGGISYDWKPAESLNNYALPNPVATPTAYTEYSVNITTDQIRDGKACVFMLTTEVFVDRLSKTPIGAFASPSVVTIGEPSILTYVGEPGAQVSWFPVSSTTPISGYTVTAYPKQPTTYTAVASRGVCREWVQVRVDAFTEGCIDTDAFVPNTFTPNGDGENDLFRVRGLKVDEVYLAVYNRWGELVYETTDKNAGWDGKYKGKDADVGVFGWYLKVKCINGAETFRKGNVTLIR